MIRIKFIRVIRVRHPCHPGRLKMPTEEQNLAELNQSRKQDAESGGQQSAASPEQADHASFPWGMFFVALLFDIVGLIPILNIFTEILVGLLLWFWQKSYAPNIDPLLSFFANKVIDICTLGIFPSNISIVIVAFMKKRAALKTPAAGTTDNLAPSEA